MSRLDLRRPGRRRSRSPAGRRRRPPAGTSPSPATQPAEVPHRPVQHRVRGPVRAGHRLREPDAVLVREQVEVGVEVRLVGEVQRAEPAPGQQVRRDRLRRLRAERPVGDVGHQVQAERRDPGDPRVLDAGVAGAALPARVGREHDAAPLDTRPARRRGSTTSASPTRETLPGRDQPREQVQRARPGVRPDAGLSTPSASNGSSGSRRHHDAEPRQRERERRDRHPLTPEPICVETKCRWKATNSATAGAASTHGAGQDRAERVGGRARRRC